METLHTDDGRECISIKLCLFCKKREIVIKYTAPYMQKENWLVKQRWKTIIIMKDMILINSGLSNNFKAKAI